MSARVAAFGASVAGLLAVALGAFAAHALSEQLTADQLAIWRTAVDYQFWHALALLALSVWMRQSAAPAKPLTVATSAFAIGIVLFSGSLYALALGAPRGFGMVTPLGGFAFLVGWSSMLIAAWRER